jgi:hypothetical protein
MKHIISHQRRTATLARIAAVVMTALSLGACSESSTSDLSDHTPPTIALSRTEGGADTVLGLSATVHDNLGIKSVHLVSVGPIAASYDTVFTTSATSTTFSLGLHVPVSVPAGTAVEVIATAFDGAGNKSVPDTLRLAVGNLEPGTAAITSPASGTIVVQGKSLIIALSGKSPVKVAGLGYTTSGSFESADSTMFSSPLLDSTASTDTIAIPTAASTGALVVTPFVRDSLGQRILGTPITLTVQSPSASTNPPAVDFGSTKRVEVTDTLHVDATDPNGIAYLGYEVRRTPNVTATPDVIDSVQFNGTLISVPHTFSLSLPASMFSTFPQTIYVRAFARNASTAQTRGYALLPNGATREDTLIVVAGVTRPLPRGGSVADALYHTGRDRLYLTNIDRDQVEVFNLADSSFKSPINVGSRPWGIAAWPRDRNGTMGDTLLVANSGGTDISYVDLTTSHEVSSIQEQNYGTAPTPYRYALPNLIAYTVTTVASTTAPGQYLEQRTKYDFSDRPQYIGATCQALGPLSCGAVMLVYSTTPTPGQSTPFADLNGTLRWENLSSSTVDARKSHFFFEQATEPEPGRSDTLEIERYDAVVPANDARFRTTLVPARQAIINPPGDTVTRSYSVVVTIDKLAFRDTTYVRNSGNFKRAVFGEGGPLKNSRAMMYDATYGFQTEDPDFSSGAGYQLTFPVSDLGVSGAFYLSDFIANTSQRISGVAINYDGALAAIRGDSTYLINSALRLQGTLPTSPSNSGLDFHPQNAGLNSSLTSRLMFTASDDANLEVWDTGCYQRVATVPIRDPIIGPIKAAVRASTGRLIIFGVTARGVVIITLPNNFSSSCT